MEQTRRWLISLVGVAVLGCAICQPPTPDCNTTNTCDPVQVTWTPVGAPEWPDGSVEVTVDPVLHSASSGQGASVQHLEVDYTLGQGALTAQRPVRFFASVRGADGGTAFFSTQARTTVVPPASGVFTDFFLMRLCTWAVAEPVIDRPLRLSLAIADDDTHALLQQLETTFTPSCVSGSCSCQ